jgi:hypothetical protein
MLICSCANVQILTKIFKPEGLYDSDLPKPIFELRVLIAVIKTIIYMTLLQPLLSKFVLIL